MSTLLRGIAQLVTLDPRHGANAATDELGVIEDAALIIDDGVIAWTGPAAQAPEADDATDCGGGAVIPGFVDSHSHLVFGGERSEEFAARMAGTPYSAGGIATTVQATRAASDDELEARLRGLLQQMYAQGTTTVEVKSGYGLTVADEQRCLALAARHTEETTFLGAHVVAPEYRDDPASYVELVTGKMLAACAPHARWIDVFCERGAFDEQASRAVLQAGRDAGLGLRVHGNQLGEGPGVRLACELGAASVDHCTYLSEADVDALAGSPTVATLLPGVEFSTRSPYPDAVRLRRAGADLAIATDCNPGSCFTSSIPFCLALAVREMGMSVPQALRAATLGGAAALQRSDIGHLAVGARADLALLDAPSYVHLAYRPGVPLVRRVWRAGEVVEAN